MKLKDKVAIVTGGGTGIGAGIASALAQQEAKVVVCGRRKGPIEELVGQINALGAHAQAVQADVSSEVDVQRLVDETMEAYGRLDILVNNAGISGGAPIHQHDIDTWDKVMAVNLRGPFLMSRAVLPIMRAQKGGHIINISSESATTHYAGNGAYGVSKHALNALSEYIQVENQEMGIRVDTICPGMVVTEMTQDNSALDHSKCLQPEDIAELASWLLTRRPNIKLGTPLLIQTMLNPWE